MEEVRQKDNHQLQSARTDVHINSDVLKCRQQTFPAIDAELIHKAH